MTITARRLVAVAIILCAALAAALLLRGSPWLVGGAVAGATALIAGVLLRPAKRLPLEEPAEIELLDETRRRELVRGTGLQLREMRYRYSVRGDPGARRPFSEHVNQVRLGFVPVVITDNRTDRQGLGYLAFVHDGRRWRGPGLPCAGSRDEALAHAERCVEPLPEPPVADGTSDDGPNDR